jgi:putrescine transport system permease protein
VTLAHITFSMVFVTTIVHSRLSETDAAVEEAAMDLGSRPWQVMRDITLPIISPAILSGWLLAFTISLDDVVITNFTTGPGTTTLPILIWSKVKLGVTPDINALATITVCIVGAGVAIAGFILNRAEKRRDRDARMAYQANN